MANTGATGGRKKTKEQGYSLARLRFPAAWPESDIVDVEVGVEEFLLKFGGPVGDPLKSGTQMSRRRPYIPQLLTIVRRVL